VGKGICGWIDATPEEMADAIVLEREAKRLEEAERKQEEAEAQRAAEIQHRCDGIDAVFAVALRKYVEAENKTARISSENYQDFEAFKECCREWGLPHLSAPPQAVALFLARACDEKHGAEHIERLRNSIDVVHRATQMPSPCDDTLVRALMRAVRDEEANEQKGNT